MKKHISLLCSVLVLLALLLPAFSLCSFADGKTLSTNKTEYTEGESILITATGDKSDWVGIYLKGDVADSASSVDVKSIYWYYVVRDGNTSGAAKDIFSAEYKTPERSDLFSIPAGEYTICLLEDDSYRILAGTEITVKKAPVPVEKTMTTDKTEYTEGDPILVTATGDRNDWVGIYKKGEGLNPSAGGVNAIRWYYVAKEDFQSGDTVNLFDEKVTENDRPDLLSLPAGEYTIYLLENDGYNILASVDIKIAAKTVTPPPAETGDGTLALFLLAAAMGTAVHVTGKRVRSRK